MFTTVHEQKQSASTDRLHAEQAFHDWQARERAERFAARPQELQFADDAYLDHETWIRPAMEALGEVRGLRVLDFGCGHGMASVVLARRGAKVTAFDLSAGYGQEARARAQANGVAVQVVQADGVRLPFADGVFDRIWGHAILHHLDIEEAGWEVRRVLAPGGRAVFCEPWGENPVLDFARRRLPYPGKDRTIDEQPLRNRQVKVLRGVFTKVEATGHQLLSMLSRLFGTRPWHRLARVEARILKRCPLLQHWCRYVVVTVEP